MKPTPKPQAHGGVSGGAVVPEIVHTASYDCDGTTRLYIEYLSVYDDLGHLTEAIKIISASNQRPK